MNNSRAQERDEHLLRRCFDLAVESARAGGYPYAAIIAKGDRIVVESINRVSLDHDITRHAEKVALSGAQKRLATTSLDDCTIYANMEPCASCCYAIREARLSKVVFGLRSPLFGGFSRWNILGDETLSHILPEVFAPPPEIVANFLAGEADAALRKASPLIWAGIRWRGLFCEAQQLDRASKDGECRHVHVHNKMIERAMRLLRTQVFDRVGHRRAGRTV
jgi:tRNA(adenine34) deaminase